MQESGLTGWYLRVLRTGSVAAGDALALERRPFPELSIARLNGLRYTPPADPGPLRQAAECPALAESWRGLFRRLAESAERAAAGRVS
jgi:MOSC domain-containing protein YiiM